jgi:hypothetical protein
MRIPLLDKLLQLLKMKRIDLSVTVILPTFGEKNKNPFTRKEIDKEKNK